MAGNAETRGRGKEAYSSTPLASQFEARKRILDAAQTLFAAHGFNATTTKAIAEQAEVPSGLIFYYFPTKQALLKNIISERNILIELRASLDTPGVAASPTAEASLEQATDPRAALVALGARYLNVMRQHKELGCILLREFRSQPALAEQFHELRQEHIQLIASYLGDACKARQRGPGDDQGVPTQAHITAIARTFLYNLIMIGLIEDPPEPLRLIEEMVAVLHLP